MPPRKKKVLIDDINYTLYSSTDYNNYQHMRKQIFKRNPYPQNQSPSNSNNNNNRVSSTQPRRRPAARNDENFIQKNPILWVCIFAGIGVVLIGIISFAIYKVRQRRKIKENTRLMEETYRGNDLHKDFVNVHQYNRDEEKENKREMRKIEKAYEYDRLAINLAGIYGKSSNNYNNNNNNDILIPARRNIPHTLGNTNIQIPPRKHYDITNNSISITNSNRNSNSYNSNNNNNNHNYYNNDYNDNENYNHENNDDNSNYNYNHENNNDESNYNYNTINSIISYKNPHSIISNNNTSYDDYNDMYKGGTMASMIVEDYATTEHPTPLRRIQSTALRARPYHHTESIAEEGPYTFKNNRITINSNTINSNSNTIRDSSRQSLHGRDVWRRQGRERDKRMWDRRHSVSTMRSSSHSLQDTVRETRDYTRNIRRRSSWSVHTSTESYYRDSRLTMDSYYR